MPSNRDPVNWSGSVLTWALRLLAAAVALRLALWLLASMIPALIGMACAAGLSYLLWLIIRIRRSRW
jgi:hypothetical protein